MQIVERSLNTKRVVEMFDSIVDYVVLNKGTKEKSEILLNLGFEMDELVCFGVSRDELDEYKEGLSHFPPQASLWGEVM